MSGRADTPDRQGHDPSSRGVVVVPASRVRLPEVFEHVRAGRVVLVVPAHHCLL